MTRTQLDMETVHDLIDGNLTQDELYNDLLPNPKDPDRFRKVRQAYEDRVDWDEPILVGLNDHLFVVGTDEGRKVKAECGHTVCDADENWKTGCEIRVREDQDELAELYGDEHTPDWSFELREYMCPGCYQLVEVEAVPSTYPVIQRFDPHIDEFYEEWLGESPPDKDTA